MSRRFGISYRTLRFYEQKRLIRPMRSNGQRFYSHLDRRYLEIVLLAKRLGFPLELARDLIQRSAAVGALETAPIAVETIGLRRQEIVDQIKRLVRQRAWIQGAIDELRAARRHEPALAELC